MVRGTEVEELQTKLLEISKTIQEASVGYLQVPLSLLFVFWDDLGSRFWDCGIQATISEDKLLLLALFL